MKDRKISIAYHLSRIRYLMHVFLFTLLLTNCVLSFSQEFTYRYRIHFKDKLNTPYQIDNPSVYLSPKAISKRYKNSIKIDQTDFPVNPSYLDSINKTGVRILIKSKWLNYVVIDSLHTDALTLNRIKSFLFVTKVDTVAKYALGDKREAKSDKWEQETVTDIKQLDKRELDNNQNSKFFKFKNLKSKIEKDSIIDDYYKYGFSYEQIDMIACNYLHELGYRGKGFTIALLDAGFVGVNTLPIFDSIRTNNRIKGTKNFVIPGGNVYTLSDHGMMVLSTIAGNIPGTYIGTAPKAEFWLLITEDVRSENIIEEDNWVAGAEFADSLGVDIINSSLGYTTFDYNLNNQTYSDLNGKSARASIAATMAARKGILVVNSAGNEGDNNWLNIAVPADADSILSVGAVDIYGKYAPFSSQGPTYDGRIKPDIVALGEGTAIASETGDITFGNGTSFSSPIIAGLAACIWETKSDASNIKIIDVIRKSSNHYKNPDYFTGYGIPNAAIANLLLNENVTIQQNINSFIIGPNPFFDKINIVIISTDTNDVNLGLYDMLGRQVYSKQNIKKDSYYTYIFINNIEMLAKGIYLLKIYLSDKVYSRKLIKVK